METDQPEDPRNPSITVNDLLLLLGQKESMVWALTQMILRLQARLAHVESRDAPKA